MAKTLIGVEITEESVRAIEVKRGRNPALVAAGSVPLPRGAARDSEVLDPEAVSLALRQLWVGHGLSGRNVILGIGSRRILAREHTTQALRPDLIKKALPFQVQDLLPVPVEQAVLDFYPISQRGDQVTGLLVAAVAENVQTLIDTLARAKLTVDAVDLLPFGLARASRLVADAHETVANVHITDHTTYVVVSAQGIPRFVRIIPVDVPTTAVTMRLANEVAAGLVEEETEEVPEPILVPAAVDDSGAGPRRARTSRRGGGAEQAVSDVVARVTNTLEFYARRPGAAPINRVLLSGAGAILPGVREGIAEPLHTFAQEITAEQLVRSGRNTEWNDREFALNLVGTAGLVMGGGSR